MSSFKTNHRKFQDCLDQSSVVSQVTVATNLTNKLASFIVNCALVILTKCLACRLQVIVGAGSANLIIFI